MRRKAACQGTSVPSFYFLLSKEGGCRSVWLMLMPCTRCVCVSVFVWVCVCVCESLSALTPFMLEDHQRPARCEAPAKESRSKQAIFSHSSPQFVIHTRLLRWPPPLRLPGCSAPVWHACLFGLAADGVMQQTLWSSFRCQHGPDSGH